VLADAHSGQYEVTVDLEKQTVNLPDGSAFSFDYDPFRKHCMLNGLDDIDYILSHKSKIDQFRRQQDNNRFFSTLGN